MNIFSYDLGPELFRAQSQSHSGRPVAQIVPLSRPHGFDDCEKTGRPGVDASARRTALSSSVDQPLYNHKILEHSAAAVSPSLVHHAESVHSARVGHGSPATRSRCLPSTGFRLDLPVVIQGFAAGYRYIWNDTVWQLQEESESRPAHLCAHIALASGFGAVRRRLDLVMRCPSQKLGCR
jgi:hypothetical protein